MMIIDLTTLHSSLLFEDEGLITHITFDPKDDNKLYYLRAATFENYSPIASKNPHNFDIFSYHIKKNEHVQHTHFSAYSMGSLNVSQFNEKIYVQLIDQNLSTADDVFNSRQAVWEIPLAKPHEMKVVSPKDWEHDIYDFTLLPDETGILFQSVSNYGQKGNFQYELFYFNWEENEQYKFTDIKSYVGRPILSPNEDTVCFIVDKVFSSNHSDYYLFKKGLHANDLEEIKLIVD